MKLSALVLALALVAQARGGHPEDPVNQGDKFESADSAAFEEHLESLAKEPEGGAQQQVAGGVTANELLELKRDDPERCSLDGLFDCWFTCEMVKPVENVYQFCLRYLDQSARFCARQVLGQNPGQFDPIRRGFVAWSRKLKLSKQMKILWTGVLKVPPGDLAAMGRHLEWAIVPNGGSQPIDGQLHNYNVHSSERLERDQLMAMLGRVKHMDVKRTIAVLSQAKHKEETELTEGVTVADMVAMNDVSEKFCVTPDEIIRRRGQCAKMSARPNVYFYCRTSIRLLAWVCQRAVEKQDEPDPWWRGLFEVLANDEVLWFVMSQESGDKTELELYLEKDPEVERARFATPKTEAAIENHE